MAKLFSSILALAVLSRPTTAQRNNLSATPPMGWMASTKAGTPLYRDRQSNISDLCFC